MATKSTDSSKKRTRKSASIQAPAVVELRKDAAIISKPQVSNLDEEIRRRAYELYLERGGMPGDPTADWFVAEQQVRSRQMQQAG